MRRTKKFEINEYHRNISKDELIADLQPVASENGLSIQRIKETANLRS